MTSPSTLQISVGLLAALLSLVPPPRPRTVAQMRRLAACRGIRSFHRDGRCLPIKFAGRSELLEILKANQ
jgi:hypothetical protein